MTKLMPSLLSNSIALLGQPYPARPHCGVFDDKDIAPITTYMFQGKLN